MTPPYEIRFPDWFGANEAAEIEDKGFLEHVLVISEDRRYRPVFYDPARLVQEVRDALDLGAPAWAEPGLVVVPHVTRDAIELAVARLAVRQFRDLPEI